MPRRIYSSTSFDQLKDVAEANIRIPSLFVPQKRLYPFSNVARMLLLLAHTFHPLALLLIDIFHDFGTRRVSTNIFACVSKDVIESRLECNWKHSRLIFVNRYTSFEASAFKYLKFKNCRVLDCNISPSTLRDGGRRPLRFATSYRFSLFLSLSLQPFAANS